MGKLGEFIMLTAIILAAFAVLPAVAQTAGTSGLACAEGVPSGNTATLAYTNAVAGATAEPPAKRGRKISASWFDESIRPSVVHGFRASTNLLSGSELEAKGIKILFKEVLSVEMVETNGVLRPMVVSRWVPCSEAPRKELAEIQMLSL